MSILLVFIIGLIPAIICYFLLKKRNPDMPGYPETCKKAVIYGMISTVPIFLAATVFYVIAVLLKMRDGDPLILDAFHTFIMAALVEEAGKFIFFRRLIRKTDCAYSWLDLTAFMILVGLGFEILESLVLSVTMGPGQSLVRGVTMMHGAFGFIMGYYYAKALRTGKKGYFVLSFMIPYLYHAIYDFTLSERLNEMFDWIAFIPVTLAALSVVIWIIVIVFFRKRKNDEYYNEPLRPEAAACVPE